MMNLFSPVCLSENCYSLIPPGTSDLSNYYYYYYWFLSKSRINVSRSNLEVVTVDGRGGDDWIVLSLLFFPELAYVSLLVCLLSLCSFGYADPTMDG